jgi:hypothetical protein
VAVVADKVSMTQATGRKRSLSRRRADIVAAEIIMRKPGRGTRLQGKGTEWVE